MGPPYIEHRIGDAFVNKDDSLNVRLDSLPVDSRLHIRDFPERQERNAAQGRAFKFSSSPVGYPTPSLQVLTRLSGCAGFWT